MNTLTKLTFATALIAGIGSTRAAVVSDFSTAGSAAAFTRATILDGDATKESSISSPAGVLLASKGAVGATGSPEQSAFTQTVAVNVGEVLRADYNFGTAAAVSTAPYADFGIFLGAAPTDLTYTSGTVSSRANYVNVYGNNQTGDLKTVGADGSTVASAFVSSGTAVTATGLYISRTATNTYAVGYVNGSGVDVLLKTYTIASGASFTNVGIYTDLRAAGTTAASLDNLRVVAAVPEPTSLGLLGLGGLALLRRRRRA